MSLLDDNKAAVGHFIQALGSGDVEALKGLMSGDIIATCTGTSVLSGLRGCADICAAAGMLGSITQAGIAFEVVSLTAEDDRVACEFEGQSTLVNGVPYNNQYFMLFTLRDGKVCRMKEYMDSKLVDATLGAMLTQALR